MTRSISQFYSSRKRPEDFENVVFKIIDALVEQSEWGDRLALIIEPEGSNDQHKLYFAYRSASGEPYPSREAIAHAFLDSDEPIGPVKLVRSNRFWLIVDA